MYCDISLYYYCSFVNNVPRFLNKNGVNIFRSNRRIVCDRWYKLIIRIILTITFINMNIKKSQNSGLISIPGRYNLLTSFFLEKFVYLFLHIELLLYGLYRDSEDILYK